jgi:CheY-like chemotaxis protein
MAKARVILIVDDEPKNLKLARDLCQVSGYETIEATDGEQGVRLTREKKPDLILMDIMMPKMDGYVACDAIKRDEATKGIPVIMLTAMGYELNKKLSRKLGADGYITKPFTHQELLEVISRFLPTA